MACLFSVVIPARILAHAVCLSVCLQSTRAPSAWDGNLDLYWTGSCFLPLIGWLSSLLPTQYLPSQSAIPCLGRGRIARAL